MGSNGFRFYCILFYVYRKLQIFSAISRLQKENLSRIFVLHPRQLIMKTSPAALLLQSLRIYPSANFGKSSSNAFLKLSEVCNAVSRGLQLCICPSSGKSLTGQIWSGDGRSC